MRLNIGKKMLAIVLAVLMMVLLCACRGNEAGSGNTDHSGRSVNTEGEEKESKKGKNDESVIDGGSLFAKNDETAEEGHWIERDVTPEGVMFLLQSPVKMDDGSFVFYGKKDDYYGQLMKYTTRDEGETWETEAVDFEEQIGGKVTIMSLISDGSCVFNSLEIDENDNLTSIKWWNLVNGKAIEIESLREKLPYVVQLFDKDSLFFSSLNEQHGDENELIHLLTGETEVEYPGLGEYYTGSISGIAMDYSNPANERMYYTDYLESGQMLYAIDRKGIMEKRIASLETRGGDGTTDEAGNYYFVHGSGICRIAKSDSMMEQIIDDATFQLGLSNYYPEDLTYVDSEAFFCFLASTTGDRVSKLLKYEWSNAPQLKPTMKILVWSLHANSTVSMAVVEYNKTHTDSEAVYQIGIEDEMADEENVLRQLNASIIAGEGPDVLVLDEIDYDKYREKGFLADISDAVNRKELISSVTDAFYNEKGECFSIPARFSVPVLMGDVGDVNKLTSFDTLKEAVLACKPRPSDDMTKETYYEPYTPSDWYAFGIYKLDQLVDFSLRASAPALITDGHINHDNLTTVMDYINVVGSYNMINRYPDNVVGNYIGIGGDGVDSVCYEDGGYEYGTTKHARYGWGTMATPAFFGEGRRGRMDEKLIPDFIVQPGLVEGAYFPSSVLGVASSSSNQEEAKEFIATVFSESVQNTSFDDGIPVLESALDKRIEKHQDYVSSLGYHGDMKAFYNALQTPVTLTGNVEVLRDYMLIHAKDMLDGKETLEAAVNGIEQDVKLMFEEQR